MTVIALVLAELELLFPAVPVLPEAPLSPDVPVLPDVLVLDERINGSGDEGDGRLRARRSRRRRLAAVVRL
ncbi:MAG: hypothetical protein ACLP01_10070 [Solirubrobacteraceae bacterium]